VQSADVFIRKPPLTPSEIVIDGGWIRDGKILPIQSKVSAVPVREQKIYDGTALGIHRIINTKEGR
jgi:glycerol kinase